MNLALSVASTMGADAVTPAGAAGDGGVGLCMGGLSKQSHAPFAKGFKDRPDSVPAFITKKFDVNSD